jgi:hypothetical protein
VLQNGNEVRPDGFVYDNKGNKIRKWFSHMRLANATIWEPKLKNIKFLESRRWFFKELMRQKFNPVWEATFQKVKNAGNFCGHKDQGLVEFGRYPGHVSWSWMEKNDSLLAKNQELVDEWFACNKLSRFFSKAIYLYDCAFRTSVDKLYTDPNKYKDNYKLHLIINGRHYWFARANKYSETFFEVIAYPEDINETEVP